MIHHLCQKRLDGYAPVGCPDPGAHRGGKETQHKPPGPRTGHELARELIAKHSRDRYPTAELRLLKIMEELGELAQARLLKIMEELGELAQALLKDGGKAPPDLTRIRKEYADAGLALYALGDKLGLNLGECMATVVDRETRRSG